VTESLAEDLERWLDDQADAAARERLRRRLDDPAAAEQLSAHLAMAGLLRTGLQPIPADLIVNRVRALMAARMPERRRLSILEVRRHLFSRRPWARVATMAIMAATLMVIALGWWYQPTGGVQASGGHGRFADGRALTAPGAIPSGSEVIADGTLTLSWPNGSRIVLDPATRLRVSADLVELSTGRLQADITHRPATAPFVVRTPSMDVTVIGTSFSVEVAGALTTTRVTAGRVRVDHRRAGGRLLDAGADALADASGWVSRPAPPAPAVPTAPAAPAAPAAASDTQEHAEEWIVLFDGRSTDGWRGFASPTVPAHWRAHDGVLERVALAAGAKEDLATIAEFSDFDLRFEWRISEGGNSGVFYRSEVERGRAHDHGHEYQIVDSARHSDGRTPLTWPGACYGLVAPDGDRSLPAGSWNRGRILARGQAVEHWLNDVQVLRFVIGSADWRARIARSTFASVSGYGRAPHGRVILQDYGHPVAFRNLRLLPLTPTAP
jgi:hypothetical protein